MLVKKFFIVGFVSSVVFSLVAMEPESNKLVTYAHSWSTPVLVIKEYFKTNEMMPKEIASLILKFFWRVRDPEENEHWVIQLAKSIGIDNRCALLKKMHLDVMFFNKAQKHGVSLICNSFDIELVYTHPHFKPLTQQEYVFCKKNVPVKFRDNFPNGSKVMVIEKKSIVRQIFSGHKDTGQLSVVQSSLCGAAIGAVLYSFVKKMTGGCLLLPEFIAGTGIGASSVGIASFLNNWLAIRNLPQKNTFIMCPLLSNEESKQLLAKKKLDNTISYNSELDNFFLESMQGSRVLNQSQKNKISKSLLLQNRE